MKHFSHGRQKLIWSSAWPSSRHETLRHSRVGCTRWMRRFYGHFLPHVPRHGRWDMDDMDDMDVKSWRFVTIRDVQTSKGTSREAAQQALREVHNKIQKLESEPWQLCHAPLRFQARWSRCVMQRDSWISELLPSSKDYNQAIVRPLEFQCIQSRWFGFHRDWSNWIFFRLILPHGPVPVAALADVAVPLGLPLGPRLSRKLCNVTWPPVKSSWNGRASAKRSDPRPTGWVFRIAWLTTESISRVTHRIHVCYIW